MRLAIFALVNQMNKELLSKEEQIGGVILFLALIASLFTNLGVYPLYLEEPRRALISLEMMYSGNWIVPTEFGEFYFKKPPFWNWLQILSFKIFGVNEFAARFFGVISFLGMGGALFWIANKYINQRVAAYATLLFLITGTGVIYMNSAAGEIDLFYCLNTFLMFALIYHFYQRGKIWHLFLAAYLLTAIGLLTKGVPSIVFTGMTLLGLFIERKQFLKLLSIQHFSGIIVMVIIVGGYAFAYHQFNDFGLYFQTDNESLVEQSAGKSFLVSKFSDIVLHLFTFPFTILFDLLPATFLIVFTFKKVVIKKWWADPFTRYLIIIFLVNILVYWLSPLTRTRYIYMLYPIPILLLTKSYFDRGGKKWMFRVIDILIISLLFVLLLGTLILPFLQDKKLLLLDDLLLTSVLLGVLITGLIWVYFKKPQLRLMTMIGAMIILRFIFDFTASPIRSKQSDMLNRKVEGQAIGKITFPEEVFIYKDTDVSHQRVFYIEQQTMNFVRLSDQIKPDHYYLVDEKYLANIGQYESLYKIDKDLRKGIKTTHLIRLKQIE